MKYFTGLLFVLLIFFSFSAFTSQSPFHLKQMVCSNKCDGSIKDGNCVPVTSMHETNIKDLCEARVKDGARNSVFVLFTIFFLVSFLSTYRVPNFQQEDMKRE